MDTPQAPNPSEDELRAMTGFEDHTSLAKQTALSILEEALVPSANAVKDMIDGSADPSRTKLDMCRWIIEFFFGKNGASTPSEATDWERAIASMSRTTKP